MIDHVQLQVLLGKVALRDRRAFRQLYKDTSPHLFGILIRITHNRTVAEEALQEAYIQIWNKAGEYNAGKSKPLTWMASIARYRALDILRKDRHEISVDDAEIIEPSAFDIEQWDHARDLKRCLGQLNDDTRQSIMLAYVSGYSHSELSQKLNRPVGTVKSWIRRGLAALRECLQI